MTPWTIVHQAHLSMRFSREEYWSELQPILVLLALIFKIFEEIILHWKEGRKEMGNRRGKGDFKVFYFYLKIFSKEFLSQFSHSVMSNSW